MMGNAKFLFEKERLRMYDLYASYSDAVLSDDSPILIYAESDVKVVGTRSGVHLFARIDNPPSWSSPIQADYPYFLSPEHMYWYSKEICWRLPILDGEGCNLQPSPLLSSLHLFIRRSDAALFCYVGTGHLVTSGFSRPERLLLSYRIDPKLSRETWVSVGGYANWLLTLGHSSINVSSSDVTHIVKSKWGGVSPYLRLTKYDGGTLQAATNDQGQAVVSYLANSESPERFSGHYYSRGEWISFPHENGESWEVPASTIIDRQEALSIITAYLRTGYPFEEDKRGQVHISRPSSSE
jgi:hypothetical protein